MAVATVKGIRIAGISGTVPKTILENSALKYKEAPDIARALKATGILRRRSASPGQCTSDLCAAAAPKLLESLKWKPEDVQALVLVTLTADYKQPATACILQNRLGLPTTTLAFDITMGCSGYVYGLYALSSMMLTGGIKKGLLCTGDTAVRTYSEQDPFSYMSNGDAGTVTALELDSSAAPMTFDLNTDGSGWQNVYTPGGGARNPFNESSLNYEDVGEGNKRRPIDTALNGPEVFAMTLNRAPETVRRCIENAKTSLSEIEVFAFNQPSQLTLDFIRRKLEIPKEKIPLSLDEFGNTSSASIPLTLLTRRADLLSKGTHKVLMSGLGTGFSWATLIAELKDVQFAPLSEI